ncbi:MAG: tetratricopeptide repeat protein [Desulfobacterales bacterium]|jgi:tetratricopeptide (TPR) repeat protein
MKSKPVILNFLSCVLAAILVFGFSGAIMAQKNTTAKSQPTKQPSKPVKKDASYWFNKGALVSTYGNNKAAVQCFQKAIALDPNFSGAYFSQGVSYGQLGQYQKAIAQINRALKMEPQNGMYYYGRGRVYLLAGDKTKAMEDFKKAADLQDEDALDYLDYINRDEK